MEFWVKLNIEGKIPLGFIIQPSSLDIKVFADQPGRQYRTQWPPAAFTASCPIFNSLYTGSEV